MTHDCYTFTPSCTDWLQMTLSVCPVFSLHCCPSFLCYMMSTFVVSCGLALVRKLTSKGLFNAVLSHVNPLLTDPGSVACRALQKPEGSTSKPKCFPIVCLTSRRSRCSFRYTGTHRITPRAYKYRATTTTTPNGRAHAAPGEKKTLRKTKRTHVHQRLRNSNNLSRNASWKTWILMCERMRSGTCQYHDSALI